MTNRWYREFFGIEEEENSVNSIVIKYIENRKCYLVNGEPRAVWTLKQCEKMLTNFAATSDDWIDFWNRNAKWQESEDPAEAAWKQECSRMLEKAYEKFTPPVVASEPLDLFGELDK